MKPELLRELCDRAMAEEMGLVIDCINPKKLSDHMHMVAKDYADLMVCVPSTPDTVMLVKKTVSLHTPEASDVKRS